MVLIEDYVNLGHMPTWQIEMKASQACDLAHREEMTTANMMLLNTEQLSFVYTVIVEGHP